MWKRDEIRRRLTQAHLPCWPLLLVMAVQAGCQPPGERAHAAEPEQILPLPVNAPMIEPELQVLPPPPPEPIPVPVLTPRVVVAQLPPELVAVLTDGAHDELADPDDSPNEAAAAPEPDAVEPESQQPFALLGDAVAPGTFAQLSWSSTETFAGASIPSAVLVAHGTKPGPVLCLTAAIHGDELNGIETVRRVLHELDPTRLTGTVIGVPIVNLQGFHRNSRYLPDRRDLNRYFPGNPTGSSAARIAYSLFNQVIMRCSALVDLHTGSFHRTNLPQLRADLNDDGVVAITQGFGSTVILHSDGAAGTLRRAAADRGIPAVTLEAGMPLQVQEDAVAHSVKGIHTLLDTMKMYSRRSLWGNPEPVYYQSRWVRVDHGGILSGDVRLGRRVQPGDRLGTVTDPISNESNGILSPYQGRVIGMALDQFVMPGYATFHIGIESAVTEATETDVDAGEVDLDSRNDIDHASEDYEGALGDGD